MVLAVSLFRWAFPKCQTYAKRLTLSLQLAAAVGATVIATSSSDAKLEVARELGAKHLINYSKTSDWATEALKLTEGRGVDLVVDVVGAQSIEQTIKATRFGGAIILVGLLSSDPNLKVNIMQDILYGAKLCKCAHFPAMVEVG